MSRVTRGDRCENIDWLSRICRTAWGKGGDRQVLEESRKNNLSKFFREISLLRGFCTLKGMSYKSETPECGIELDEGLCAWDHWLDAQVQYNEASLTVYGKEAVMQLEDYFVFLAPDDIRIRGTRIGIEHVLYEYIHNAKSPEEVAQTFQTVTLAQVYATVLYYLENRETVGQYIADWLDYTLKSEAEHDQHPPAIAERLRQLRATQETKQVPV